MYSTTFALAAILGIALVNMFLGFAFASLIGRGPRRWSDVEKAVTIRYISTSLLIPRWRRKADKGEPAQASVALVSEVVPSHTASTNDFAAPAPLAASAVALEVRTENGPSASPPQIPAAPIPNSLNPASRLVLPPKASADSLREEPVEESLQRQLTGWLANEQRIETPSMSGLRVTVRDLPADPVVAGALMDAICGKITAQLRKDRRVLRPQDSQFVWFAADTNPDDGLLPLSRIRQLLEKTRFLIAGAPVVVETAAALMSVTTTDNPAGLLKRMQQTLAYAQEKGNGSLCVELGDGPNLVEPVRMDVDASDCVVV
jgi:hypothetical protein